MYKIIIVDDHPIVRNGLKQIVSDEKEFEEVQEASNSEELFEFLNKENFDLIILDIAMPGMNGLDALIKIRNIYPEQKVFILSALSEDLFAIRAIKAGASGYMHKECAPESLIHAIRRILKGGVYISQNLSEKLAGELKDNSKKAPYDRLSEREFQVMRLIASGKTISAIAEDLSLSVTTISTYHARILEKLGLKNSSELTVYCVREGLV